MTANEIKSIFPNASASTISANIDCSGKNAALERNPWNAPLGEEKVQGRTDERILVRITSVRKRLADEDGLCEKYLVDCCRYAGLIPDDAPGVCKIETGQRKVEKGEEEHTVIEISQPTH